MTAKTKKTENELLSRGLAIIAHHYAACVVIGLEAPRWRFNEVGIDPHGCDDGRPDGWLDAYTFTRWLGGVLEGTDYEKAVISMLAGVHAQRRFAPTIKWRWDVRGDHMRARTQIKEKLGLTGRAAVAKFAELDALAAQAVNRHWPDITKLAGALLKKHRLTYDEVRHDVLGEPRLFRERRNLIY